MNFLLSSDFWLSLLVYILSSFFVFFVPGFTLIRSLRLKLESFGNVVLSFALGFSLWGAQGYIFGYAHMRVLTYMYVFFCILCAFIYRKAILSLFGDFLVSLRKGDMLTVGLLGIGVFIQVLQTVGSGLPLANGMPFFRVHIQDGIYHLSLISSMIRAFPPIEPGAVGVAVQNYHYWSDLVFAEQSRIFHISVPYLFFQFSPILIALLTGLTVWALCKAWSTSKILPRAALFFLFFGADAGYLVTWLVHRVFSFQYPVIDNGATQFLNMPHAFAKLIFFSGMLALYFWMKRKEWRWGIATIILTVVLFGFKIYFALYMVLGLACIGALTFVKFLFSKKAKHDPSTKKYFIQQIVLGVIGGMFALLVYLPPNRASGGLQYYPLEWPKLMLARDNIDWTQWRYKYAVAQLGNDRNKLLLYDAEAIIVTIVAIHGTRFLGVLVTKRTTRQLGGEWIAFLIVPTLIFTWLGLYTLQVSGGFNVFNFFATSLAPLALLSAFLVTDMWESRKILLRVGVLVLIVVTVPRIVFETQKILYSYVHMEDVHTISTGEQIALSYIDHVLPKDCVVASSTDNALDIKTPYVSFYANRFSYMSGQSVLETHNQPTVNRFNEYKQLFSGGNGEFILDGLRKKNVCALYIQRNDSFAPTVEGANPHIVFKNDTAEVIDLR